MADHYTPTTEEIREYIEASDRVTAHMFSPEATAAAEAFDRWLAAHDEQLRAQTLRDEAKRLRGFLSGYTHISLHARAGIDVIVQIEAQAERFAALTVEEPR